MPLPPLLKPRVDRVGKLISITIPPLDPSAPIVEAAPTALGTNPPRIEDSPSAILLPAGCAALPTEIEEKNLINAANEILGEFLENIEMCLGFLEFNSDQFADSVDVLVHQAKELSETCTAKFNGFHIQFKSIGSQQNLSVKDILAAANMDGLYAMLLAFVVKVEPYLAACLSSQVQEQFLAIKTSLLGVAQKLEVILPSLGKEEEFEFF